MGRGLMRRSTHSSWISLIRWAAQIVCHGDLPHAIYTTLKSRKYLPFVDSSKRQLVAIRLMDFCIASENLVFDWEMVSTPISQHADIGYTPMHLRPSSSILTEEPVVFLLGPGIHRRALGPFSRV